MTDDRESQQFKLLSREFSSVRRALRNHTGQFQTVSKEAANKFDGVYPYPDNVVTTTTGAYINASWMTDSVIAAQYPTIGYYARWLLALLQSGCSVILMLCQLQEAAVQPAYFPLYCGQSLSFSDVDGLSSVCITTTVCRWYSKERVTLRTLRITSDSGYEWTITHIHYAGWPDHETPTSLSVFFWLQQLLNTVGDDRGVRVVHCAAGIGRTGTFLAAYLRKADESAESVVRRLRQKRPLSVHNLSQYKFVAALTRVSPKSYKPHYTPLLLSFDHCTAVLAVVLKHCCSHENCRWKLDVDHVVVYVCSNSNLSVVQLRSQLLCFTTVLRQLRSRDWNEPL